MQLHVVTSSDPLLRLAERCEKATRGETISCLREAFELLYGDRMSGLGGPKRVFETMVEALALNELALLLIPANCAERVDWHRYASDPHIVTEVTIERVEDCKAIGRCESYHRALAYTGAALRAHAYLHTEKNGG